VSISDLYCWHIQHRATENLALALPQFYQPPSEQPPGMDMLQTRVDFQNLIESYLDKRVTPDTTRDNLGLVLWRNAGKLNLHIINYDCDYAAGQISDKTDLPLMVDAALFPQPSRVSVISPDYLESTELPFSITDGFLCFTVPKLHAWDIIIIE
jgi:hypothetical protein